MRMKGQTLKRVLAVLVLAVSAGLVSIPAYSYEISVYVQATCTRTTTSTSTTNNPSQNADGTWNGVDSNGNSRKVDLGGADGRDPKSYEGTGTKIPTTTTTTTSSEEYDCSYTATVVIPGNTPSETMRDAKAIEKKIVEEGRKIVRNADGAEVSIRIVEAQNKETKEKIRINNEELQDKINEGQAQRAGDPVLITSGQYEYEEVDIKSGDGLVRFEIGRSYLSRRKIGEKLGRKWYSSLDSRIIRGYKANPYKDVEVYDEQKRKIGTALSEARKAYAEMIRQYEKGIAESDEAIKLLEQQLMNLRNCHYADKREIIGAIGETERVLDSMRTHHVRLKAEYPEARKREEKRIAGIEEQYEQAKTILLQAIDEKNHYETNRDLNRKALRGEGFSELIESGNDTVQVFDEKGQRHVFLLKEKIVYGGGWNYYPNGSESEPLDVREKSHLTLLSDGRMIWEKDNLERWIYSKEGLLERIENLSGYGIDFRYDEQGRVQNITAEDRTLLTVEHDEAGRITALTNQAGQVIRYEYRNGLLSAVIDEEEDRVGYEYEGKGLLTRIVKSDGSGISIEYGQVDEQGNTYVTATEDEEGNREQFTYHIKEKYTVHTNHSGVVEKIWYNGEHRTVREEKADGRVIETVYDDKGNKREESINGRAAVYTYDVRGNCIQVRYADGSSEKWQYNDKDQKTEYEDRDGVKMQWVYDRHGLCVGIYRGGVAVWEGSYDEKGRLRSSKEAGLGEKRYCYDDNGYISCIRVREDGKEITERYENDGIGRIVRYEDGEGQVWRYEYGKKEVTEISPLGLVKRYRYNGRKDVVSVEEEDSETKEKRITKIRYDRRHLPVWVKDGSGEITEYTYRADGKVIQEKKGAWEKIFEYDAAGRIAKIIQKKEGSEAEYESGFEYAYRGSDAIQAVRDGLDRRSVYRYDQWGRLTEQENAAGEVFKRKYSAAGRLISAQGSYGGAYRFTHEAGFMTGAGKEGGSAAVREYSPIGLVLSETDREGNRTRYEYTERGLTKRIIKAEGVVSYRYDGAGRVVEAEVYTHSNGQRLRSRYRYEGRKIREEKGAYRREYELNGWEEVISETDGEGYSRRYEYDGAGRLTEVQDGIGRLVTYTYNALNRIASKQEGSAEPVRYTYNAIGRIEKVQQGNEHLLTRSYDKAGRLVREKKQGVPEKTYNYDALGRVIEVKTAGRISAQYRYGAYGRTVTFIDGKGNAYLFEKDGYGLLTEERDRMGGTKRYGYDGEDELKEERKRNGQVIRKEREGGKERTVYSDGSVYEIVFDVSGNVIAEKGIDGKGRITSEAQYRYDEGGLLTEVEDKGASTRIRYTYNKAGYRTAVETNDRHIVYEVDGRGRVTEVSDRKQLFTVRVQYDGNDREIKRILGNGNIQQYTYDENGRLLGIVETAANGAVIRAECYGYDGEGRRIYTADEKGNFTRYAYDELYRIEAVHYPATDEIRSYHKREAEETGVLIDEQGTYAAREILEPLVLAGVQSTFNRLNGARGSHLGSQVNSIQMVWSERYTYDANGNIATKTTPYGTIHYTYDKENRLLTRGTVHYTYDEEGNLLEEESKDRYNKRYTYTGFNRIEVSDVLNHTDYTHTITGYRYDSFGRRVLTFEQDKPGMRTIYDGLTFEVVKEAETFLGTGNITSDLSGEANIQNYNPHGSEHTKGERYYWRAPNGGNEQKGKSGQVLTGRSRGVRTYLYLNGERVAINNLYNTNHGQYYYGADILGSVKFVTGQGGQEIKRIGYDIFGGIYQGDSPLGLETGYTGKPYDAVTGLSDYGFRDYAPSHARFITEDPIRDGENWFTYVGNNPVNWVDPWGLSASDGKQGNKKQEPLEEFVSILRSTVGADYSHTRMPTRNEMDCSGMCVYALDKMGYKVDKNLTAKEMASGKVPWIELFDNVDNARQGEKGVLNFYKFRNDYVVHMNYGVGKQGTETENQIVDASEGDTWQAGRNKQGDIQNPKALPDKVNKTWAPFSTKTSPDIQGKIDFTKLEHKEIKNEKDSS